MLRNLHELASESLLDIASFTPKPIVAKTQYTEWPIELGLEGSYHDLGRFFDRIATHVAADVGVGPADQDARRSRTAAARVAASCVATTFVFKKDMGPDDARPAPPTTAQAPAQEASSEASTLGPRRARARRGACGRSARRSRSARASATRPTPSGYDDGGRRDPFVSLIVAEAADARHAAGPAPPRARPGVARRSPTSPSPASSRAVDTMTGDSRRARTSSRTWHAVKDRLLDAHDQEHRRARRRVRRADRARQRGSTA